MSEAINHHLPSLTQLVEGFLKSPEVVRVASAIAQAIADSKGETSNVTISGEYAIDPTGINVPLLMFMQIGATDFESDDLETEETPHIVN